MIKNIIFDIGDVLIEYRWQDMLKDYNCDQETIQTLGNKMFQHPLWKQLDDGLIGLENAIKAYAEEFPQDADIIEWFLQHAEQMSVARPDVWERIPKLKEKGYRIYLLSNYSKELLEKHTQGASFYDYIDGGVISYQVHLSKPDSQIYQTLLDKYELESEECLFFDDREENVAGAKEVGIHATQVTSRQQLIEELDNILNLG